MMAKPTRQRLCKQPQHQTSLRRFTYNKQQSILIVYLTIK